MIEQVQLSKMSIKALGCKPVASDEPTPLCTIFGKASSLKSGEAPNGSVWTALVGNFMGINLATNEVYRSSKLFLPEGIQDGIADQIKTEGFEGEVKFAYTIRSVKGKSPVGYIYQAMAVIDTEVQNDPLADMAALIPAGAKQKTLEAQKALESAAAAGERPAIEAPKKGKK